MHNLADPLAGSDARRIAAGRIVALTLVSNGEINDAERFALFRTRAQERLGLDDDAWQTLLADALEGLSPYYFDPGARGPSGSALGALNLWASEVDDPDLQSLVVRLSAALAAADGYVDPGEAAVLRTLLDRWLLPRQDQDTIEALIYGLDFEVRPRCGTHA